MEEADEEAWTDPVDTRLTHSRTRSRAMRNARPGVLGAFGQTCEVCVGTLDRMLEGTKRTDRNQVEKAIDAYCDTAQDKEAKLCYSLSVIKKDVSQVVSMGLPTPKICERLSKKDETVCELKYPKPPTDLKPLTTDVLQKMRVKALRDILDEHSAPCIGCVEKNDFVERIQKLRDEL